MGRLVPERVVVPGKENYLERRGVDELGNVPNYRGIGLEESRGYPYLFPSSDAFRGLPIETTLESPRVELSEVGIMETASTKQIAREIVAEEMNAEEGLEWEEG